MTLSVETHDGATWLVAHKEPGDVGEKIARFLSDHAAGRYIALQSRAMAFAREVGRLEI